MSVVAAYHIFMCALFLVQGGMWTGYSQSTYLLSLVTIGTKTPKFSFIDCNILKCEGLRVCNSGILTLYLVKNGQLTQALK